jgi:hypothetical protein
VEARAPKAREALLAVAAVPVEARARKAREALPAVSLPTSAYPLEWVDPLEWEVREASGSKLSLLKWIGKQVVCGLYSATPEWSASRLARQ